MCLIVNKAIGSDQLPTSPIALFHQSRITHAVLPDLSNREGSITVSINDTKSEGQRHMMVIHRIGIGSAFKVSAVMSVVLWAIFGLLLVVAPDSLDTSNDFGRNNFEEQSSSVSGILVYLCGIPLQAVVGGLVGALMAFLYNVAAGWVGGIEIELKQPVNPYAGTPYQQSYDQSSLPGRHQPSVSIASQNRPPPVYQPPQSSSPPQQTSAPPPDDWRPVPFDDDKQD